MKKLVVLTIALCSLAARGQTAGQPGSTAPKIAVLRCAALLDGKLPELRRNVEIVVEGENIKEVRPATGAGNAISLSGVCMPGLIDTHTHVLLQGDITAADYDVQLLKLSLIHI